MIRTNVDFLTYIELLNEKYPNFFLIENYNPKEVILKQQKRYQSLYIIKNGITKCYLSDENGKDFIQEFLGKGMEFGELEIFSGNLSYCSIEAISKVVVYKISYKNYNYLLDNDRLFNRLVIKSMALKIGYKAPRHSFQQSYSIEENILKLKHNYPDYDKIFSKNDIANYLGITIRSLNRTLNGLK
ncbi:Crp/Fnr family transcriptional regulator [Tenacibaculum sp. E3R01]|uniref:Crp/Fnr family transcriptional regulator n=1 Tax=Tenacibaculum sp. E3R01 TaxID=2267227 RepID=UPI000DEB642B|nr:Crp/Fnr family transcriptional regulator [Tenacibaculum sp. E3R01]RBW56502.1 Crp/Fnr family transcriptional regulator [Tenacibaculum sp. E3R01]